MAEPFLSEIRLMSFTYPPHGWALCNGQLMAINQNQALFALLGTTYGGDGIVTFALPNLQGRVPMHFGNGHALGEQPGSQSVTLTAGQLPTHMHTLAASSDSTNTKADPASALLAPVNGGYGAANNLTTLDPSSVTSVGNSQPHDNMQPYLTLSYCIATSGIFPSPT